MKILSDLAKEKGIYGKESVLISYDIHLDFLLIMEPKFEIMLSPTENNFAMP